MQSLVFEVGLAIGLMTVATIIADRLRLSVVPFLILIGLAVGPHAPHFGPLDLRFMESRELIEFMGRMGVLFLLFYLGLEFSIGRLIRAGRSITMASAIYIAINLTFGLLFGWLVAEDPRGVLVVAGITTISSSAIVAKVIVDLRRSARPETRLILGIIMGEDIFLALYIAVVSGLVLYGSTSPSGIATSAAIAVSFVAVLFIIGRYFARHLNRWLGRLSEEALVLVAFAALFLLAGLAGTLGLAEAIGALLLGLVFGETTQSHAIQRVSTPFRDFFGAFLFFSFGLGIDPLSLGGAAWLAVAAVGMTIVGNVAAGVIVGLVGRLPAGGGLTIGLTIVSRGEFSIIMASLAAAGGLLPFIQPFTALYVLILSVLGPLLTKESDRIYGAWRRLARLAPGIDAARPAEAPDSRAAADPSPETSSNNPGNDGDDNGPPLPRQ